MKTVTYNVCELCTKIINRNVDEIIIKGAIAYAPTDSQINPSADGFAYHFECFKQRLKITDPIKPWYRFW